MKSTPKGGSANTGTSHESVADNSKVSKLAELGGDGVARYQSVNLSYEQERFHAQQGHGFAAERANTLHDKLHGKDARMLGDDNTKNGPDRIVNGEWIQSKYFQDGRQAIDACFEDGGKGAFRYIGKHDSPMTIEVPKDENIYNQAVERMQEKIRNGQVEGITDPAEAKNIVRQGNYTYQQARNIARAGNIDSLKYDATNGAVVAASAFGVSAVIAFCTSVWSGDSPDIAAKKAALCGVKVAGTSFFVSVLSQQLLKAGLNSAMVSGTEAIANALGPKACAVIVNAFRSGSNIYGAAAMKSAAKLLRGNAVVASLTVVALSSVDIYDIVRGRISSAQLAKNLATTIGSVAGGTGGWVGGAALGTAIFPGPGTIVGGVVGSLGGGVAVSNLIEVSVGHFVKDDAEQMLAIITEVMNNVCNEYLLCESEVNKVVESIQDALSHGSTLKDMYASDNRKEFARALIAPPTEEVVKNRKEIDGDIDEILSNGLVAILKEAAEDSDENGDDGATSEGSH